MGVCIGVVVNVNVYVCVFLFLCKWVCDCVYVCMCVLVYIMSVCMNTRIKTMAGQWPARKN